MSDQNWKQDQFLRKYLEIHAYVDSRSLIFLVHVDPREICNFCPSCLSSHVTFCAILIGKPTVIKPNLSMSNVGLKMNARQLSSGARNLCLLFLIGTRTELLPWITRFLGWWFTSSFAVILDPRVSAATFSSSVCFGTPKEYRWISLAPVVVHSASVRSRTDVTYLKKSNDGLYFSSHLSYPFIVTQMWLREQCSGVSAGRSLSREGWTSTRLCKHTP